MRKVNRRKGDDLRAEYDFTSLTGGVRGKYSRRYRAGVNLALLEPEIAQAFPTDAAVNEALRTAMRASKASKRSSRLPTNRMQRTRPAQGTKPRR
jgi:hypothetical protein